jgi:ABC-2 type transport system ATP-binding protein
VEFAGLSQFIDTPVKNYSSGMYVRLGFAVAAHVDPEVLLIDEVLAVGDEVFQRKCAERIELFRREGRTIVLVSHGLSQVEQLCEQVVWIDKGELKMIGPAGEVISAYQGQSHEAVRVQGEQGERWGSGEIVISKISIFDERGLESAVLSTMEAATILIDLESHIPIQDFVVGLRIDSLSGHRIWGSNSRRNGKELGLIQGLSKVQVVLPAVPLLEGVYDLTASVTDHTEIHPYDHWEKRIRFEVKQFKVFDIGEVHIETRWTVEGTKPTMEKN